MINNIKEYLIYVLGGNTAEETENAVIASVKNAISTINDEIREGFYTIDGRKVIILPKRNKKGRFTKWNT